MIKQTSNVYQLFLSLFFKPDGDYPLVLECPSGGKAISLAQKLNQCRKQHIGNAPGDICPWSAKAQGNTVVISSRASSQPRAAQWIKSLAEQHEPEPISPSAPHHPQEPVDRQEEILSRLWGNTSASDNHNPRPE